MDGRVIWHTARTISYSGIWMRLTIEAIVARYGLDAGILTSRLSKDSLFEESKQPIVRRGLEAYFSGDYLVAIHLLVPQIEDALRCLLERVGGDVLRPNRTGGMDLRTLDDVLRDQHIIAVLTADGAEYLRILLTDRRGINLRNDLAHGMLPSDLFDRMRADRVFHAFVLVTLILPQGGQASSS